MEATDKDSTDLANKTIFVGENKDFLLSDISLVILMWNCNTTLNEEQFFRQKAIENYFAT
jgi:hypothetical protein